MQQYEQLLKKMIRIEMALLLVINVLRTTTASKKTLDQAEKILLSSKNE